MSSTLNYYGKKFEDLMVRSFYSYGMLVGKYPKWFLWGPVLFTFLCTPGLFFLKINLDLYRLFVPLDAPVRYEFERQHEFNRLPQGDLNMPRLRRALEDLDDDSLDMELEREERMAKERRRKNKRRRDNAAVNGSMLVESVEDVVVAPSAPMKNDILRFYVVHKDFDNLLQSKYLSALYRYTNEMMKVTMEYEGETIKLERFCKKDGEPTCSNLLNVWLKHADVLFRDGKVRNNPNLQLSYPVMYLFNRPRDIGNVIYGVNVTGEKNEIVGARVLTLHWFMLFPETPFNRKVYPIYRDALNEFWKTKATESGVDFIPHNDKAMDDEMLKIIETTVPFAFPATIMLMFFVIFANWSTHKEKSKPVEMYLGVISVIMALVCTFGIFFVLGVAFNPVTSTMPFLILAVGVDDDFLMIGAWRELDTRLPVDKRIALVMGDAGASITVTSFTNFFCFALGYFMCSTPAVADFCLITAWGVIFDYLMQVGLIEWRTKWVQVTFFAAVLVFSGHREKTGGLASCCYKKTDEVMPAAPAEEPSYGTVTTAESEPEKEIDPTHHEKAKNVPYMHKFFRDKFSPFILREDVKIVSWLVFAVYAVAGIYGCCIIVVDISPTKYIRDNSPIQTFVKLADKYIWADNVMPVFHVMNPPDLRDPGQRARLNELIFRLEHTNYSVGRVSTNLWVWQYQQYLNDFPDVNYKNGFYDRRLLNNFFNQLDYQQYRPKVKILDNVTNGEPCISAFTFETSFYGLDSWDKRQSELFLWRRLIREYPEFDIFLAGIFSPFLIDQRHTIAPSSMQTIGSALAMMALISFFFLPDAQSVFLMTWSLLSISMGVCGGLALLGSDLDSVSMGCIVMAIGLAVDYSVHICYRYHRSEEKRAYEKVRDTLTSVALPICQAVGSTLVGLAVLPLVPAYLVRVFFQTVYLVNIIGLTHALVWLPQMISALDPCERIPLRVRYEKRQ